MTKRARELAQAAADLARVAEDVVGCRRCPRLRAYCEEVARVKRRAYADQAYWGKPVPGFGDSRARIWIVGLAPAAHGGNRTGRVFTGDRSGDFLFAALHRAGLANRPESIARDDGLSLAGVYVSAAVRCAPPGNRPAPDEVADCASYLDRESAALRDWRVTLCLGALAWESALLLFERSGARIPRPRPKFAHGAAIEIAGRSCLASYHVSQQNTFTKRLTPAMLDRVITHARVRAEL